ncbi:hypothetical protein HPULCUR_011498 [Helicostylum pulchrum]|uniref:CTLH domain-containing protein n=1 Tax=Helicostylum pulchrum TaxID=562976 RepID=A0ABP9YGC0_9FUNG
MDSECHSMVIEYLIHNCFKNTAKALINETSRLEDCNSIQKGNIKKNLMDLDNELTDAIEQGDILEAFALIKKHFPVLASLDNVPNSTPPNDHEAIKLHTVLFKLKCQRFIEIIRSTTPSSELEAIRYAQTHLKATNSELKEKVKEVTALIAYANPHQSQSKHLLTQERREQLAKEVNDVLLTQCNLPVQTSIEKVARQYSLVEEELQKYNVVSPARNYREKMAI